MPRAQKKTQLIEFKGNSLPVIAVTLRTLQPEQLAKAASALFGDEAFFDGDAALIELNQIDEAAPVNWAAVRTILDNHGLHVIGVRGGSPELQQSAASAGLPSFASIERTARAATPAPEAAVPETPEPAAVVAAPPAPPAPQPPPVVASTGTPTLVIDRPLRSGQQIYARGGDLVVLAAVNSGAEVIADGSIHIYAPLRGRALAGASGATSARIFTTRFEAELVSIAGVYRTFDTGVPDQLAGQPVQVQLSETPGETSSRLSIEALKTN